MKTMMMLALSCVFCAAGYAEPSNAQSKMNCGCKECPCTPEADCGCCNGQGCHCVNGECQPK